MRADDDEVTSVKLEETVKNVLYLCDYSHECYANKKEAALREVLNKMDVSKPFLQYEDASVFSFASSPSSIIICNSRS
jgi:hypothetical protein